jgi:hypothetical protein
MRDRRVTGLIAVGCVLVCAGSAYALGHTGRGAAPPAAKAAAAKSPGKIRLRIARPTASVAPGGVASFKVRIRPRDRRLVRLRVRSGSYRIRLSARSGKRRAKSAVNLVIEATRLTPTQPAAFTISGSLPGALIPGTATPLDLTLSNPGPSTRISSLGVAVRGVIAPQADATHPCTVDDFSVTQFSGTYGFTLPSSSTRSLSQLGFPAERWPVVAMLNRPVNQDGCKGASVDLSYTGTSTGDEG